MKQKLAALISALALALALAGCTVSTPDTVGKIGDYEVSSGLYLLAQLDAYQQAAELASDEQDSTNVKKYLKQTITTDDESGETALVSDYVAQKTEENLRLYAAVETRFAQLGGELNELEKSEAADYASQLYEQNGDVYKANGIGFETIERFEEIMLKSNKLLALEYGENGAAPVSDTDITAYLKTSAAYVCYVLVPLYNADTYVFADDEQKAEMLSLAQGAAADYNAAVPEGAAAQTELFKQAANKALPDIYGVLGADYTANDSDFGTALLTESTFENVFTAEGAKEEILALNNGEATAVMYSDYSIMLLVKLDPIEAAGMDEVRDTALTEMKGEELNASLKAYGEGLSNNLDEAATKKLPANNIKAG